MSFTPRLTGIGSSTKHEPRSTALQTILTRIGDGTKVVFTGDTSLIDTSLIDASQSTRTRFGREPRPTSRDLARKAFTPTSAPFTVKSVVRVVVTMWPA